MARNGAIFAILYLHLHVFEHQFCLCAQMERSVGRINSTAHLAGFAQIIHNQPFYSFQALKRKVLHISLSNRNCKVCTRDKVYVTLKVGSQTASPLLGLVISPRCLLNGLSPLLITIPPTVKYKRTSLVNTSYLPHLLKLQSLRQYSPSDLQTMIPFPRALPGSSLVRVRWFFNDPLRLQENVP